VSVPFDTDRLEQALFHRVERDGDVLRDQHLGIGGRDLAVFPGAGRIPFAADDRDVRGIGVFHEVEDGVVLGLQHRVPAVRGAVQHGSRLQRLEGARAIGATELSRRSPLAKRTPTKLIEPMSERLHA
jgi:hypothetical protein